VLAGTDVTGSIPRDVALRSSDCAEDTLAGRQQLASPVPRRRGQRDIVTYHHDPREDPDQLAGPAAVVAGGIRLR
jgi:hypothetical protein